MGSRCSKLPRRLLPIRARGRAPPDPDQQPTTAAKAAGGPRMEPGEMMLEECGPLRGAALIHQAERGRTRPMCPVELSDGPGSVRPMSY